MIMTWLERYLKENPEAVGCDDFIKSIVEDHCPYDFFDYEGNDICDARIDYPGMCTDCWNRPVPEKKEEIDIEAINVEFEEDDIMPPIMPPEEEKEDTFIREMLEKSNKRDEEEEKESPWNSLSKSYEEINTRFPDLVKKVKEMTDKAMNVLDSKNNPCTGTFIRDSGNRREFTSGAVRDITDGKGRCDLLPIDVVGIHMHDPVFTYIDLFQDTGDEKHLYDVIDQVTIHHKMFESEATMFLEVAKHFEEGAKKYNENNWRLGIPAHCYIDSAVRHYLKYLRGDTDEHHDRAFCWNILCCIWTCLNKPELNDYCKEEK